MPSRSGPPLAPIESRLRWLLPADLYAAAWVDPSPATLTRVFEHLRTLQRNLQDYLPRLVIAASATPGQAQHAWQEGTLMFTDLAGFTPLLEANMARGAEGATALHLLCGLEEAAVARTLNDYLLGRCDIEQTVHAIAPPAGQGASLMLVPASTSLDEIARMLRKGYDLRLLDEGFQTLIEQLRLDTLIVDTHAGLHEEALTLMALADTLAIVLRHDQQDYQGTAVMVDVARRLDVPRISLIANEVPPRFDLDAIRTQVERSYGCVVAGALPHSDGVLAAEPGFFALRHPAHPLALSLREVGAALARSSDQ
jgi:septum site-determining protein MinD